MTRRTDSRLWIWLAASVFLVAVSSIRINRWWEWRFPPLSDLVVTEGYTADLGAILLGSHHLASELAYIQFLQYYGEEKNEAGGRAEDFGRGHYPLTYQFGERLVRLDPYFNAPVLEIAGSLAFNLDHTDQGISLLTEGIRLDPAFYRYRMYVAAILYKNNKKDDRLISMLLEAIRTPDCPVLLKNVLGNLLKKSGDYLQAAYVYRHIIETAKLQGERSTAARSLQQLLIEHPEAQAALNGPGRF